MHAVQHVRVGGLSSELGTVASQLHSFYAFRTPCSTRVTPTSTYSQNTAPLIDLDSKKYKLVQQLDAATKRGVPSLLHCSRLSIKGYASLSARCAFAGAVSIVNKSDELKAVPPKSYKDETIDVTDGPGLGPLKVTVVSTKPIEGQKPGEKRVSLIN